MPEFAKDIERMTKPRKGGMVPLPPRVSTSGVDALGQMNNPSVTLSYLQGIVPVPSCSATMMPQPRPQELLNTPQSLSLDPRATANCVGKEARPPPPLLDKSTGNLLMTTQPPVSAGDGNYVGDKSLLSLLLKSSDQFMVDEGCDEPFNWEPRPLRPTSVSFADTFDLLHSLVDLEPLPLRL